MACYDIIDDGCPTGKKRRGGVGLGADQCVSCDDSSQSAGDLVVDSNSEGGKQKGDFWKKAFQNLPGYLSAGADIISAFNKNNNSGSGGYSTVPTPEPPLEEKDNSMVILVIVILFVLALMFFLFRRRPTVKA